MIGPLEFLTIVKVKETESVIIYQERSDTWLLFLVLRSQVEFLSKKKKTMCQWVVYPRQFFGFTIDLLFYIYGIEIGGVIKPHST